MKKILFIFISILTSCKSFYSPRNYTILKINPMSTDVYDIYLQDVNDHSKIFAIPSNDSFLSQEIKILKVGDTLHVRLIYNKVRNKMRRNNEIMYKKDTLMYNNVNVNMDYYLPCLDGLYIIKDCENYKREKG